MTSILDVLHQPHTQLFLRLVLGGLLLLAGASKLAGLAAFRGAVAEYKVLPPFLEAPFAFVLPFAEVTLGGLLLLGFGTTAASAIAALLFLSFAFAIGLNLARGRHFDCHCFGSVQRDTIGWPAFLRSLALVAAAFIVAIGSSRFGALEYALLGSSTTLPSVGEIVPVVFLAFVFFDALILLPELLAERAAFKSSHGHRRVRSAA
jgi:uncharacterized membrane protein YphA (DoxX/SURF4 family)